HAHYGLSLEHASRRQVEKWKLGLGAADARHSRARLGRLAIPQDAVARTIGHWPTAAEVVKKAAATLTELGRRNLVSEMHVPRAAGLSIGGEEGFRPLQVVESDFAAASGCHDHENLGHPVRMGRASWDVNHRKSAFRLESRSEQSTAPSF